MNDDGISRRAVLRNSAVATGGLIASGATGTIAATPGKGKSQNQKCELVVPDDYGTIQDAVDNSNSGTTICVEPGTYSENISVDAEVTIRGRTAPTSGRPAVIDGWISLDADGAELYRMVVTRTSQFTTSDGFTPDPFGVRVAASNTVIADNIIYDLTDAPNNNWGAINGIQVFGDEQLSNVMIRANEVRNTTKEVIGGVAGVKLQAAVTDVEITGNSVTDLHSPGWVWGVVLTGSSSTEGHPKKVLVEENTMDRLNDGSQFDVFEGDNEGRASAPYPGSAFGIDEGAGADKATVRYNNLAAPNGAESKDENNTLVMECNWWGAKSGPTNNDNSDGEGSWAVERGDATIDFTPWLTAPAPSRACVGGTGNGQDQ